MARKREVAKQRQLVLDRLARAAAELELARRDYHRQHITEAGLHERVSETLDTLTDLCLGLRELIPNELLNPTVP